MALNIRVSFSEAAEASALAPMEIELCNDDSLPMAFKLHLKNPHRYITNWSHGFVQAKSSRTVLLRLRAPHELHKDKSNSVLPVSILKASSGGKGPRSRSPDEGRNSPGSPSSSLYPGEVAEIARVDIRVITALVPDPATEADFERYWPSGFHHSTHMVPFKALFLTEDEFFGALLQKQEKALKEAETEREGLRKRVDAYTKQVALFQERNEQFSVDLIKLRRQAASAQLEEKRQKNRVTVPLWVCCLSLGAAVYSAATIAFT